MHQADIAEQKRIFMLAPELRAQTFHHLIRSQFEKAGCLRGDGRPWEDVFPRLAPRRVRVATGSEEFGCYNHQSGICRWRDKYWYVFSNSAIHEEVPGMRTMVAHSDDLGSWSPSTCVAAGDVPGDMWRQTGGILAHGDRLIVLVQTKTGHHLTRKPGMSAGDITKTQYKVGLFWSADGENWTERDVADDCYWFEPPKLTAEGRLLCAGTRDNDPIVFLWPGDDPLAQPEIVAIPHDKSRDLDSGCMPYGEASWYQTDDGTIVLFHRNETDELRLRVALSEDGGRSWTEPILSDIPDSMSRVSAGRLADGRFYLVGNAIADLLNRVPLMLLISDDGYKFHKQYILLDEPTRIELPGVLKAHGYQYPFSLVEPDRLIVTYSVNKEHMELLTVPIDSL